MIYIYISMLSDMYSIYSGMLYGMYLVLDVSITTTLIPQDPIFHNGWESIKEAKNRVRVTPPPPFAQRSDWCCIAASLIYTRPSDVVHHFGLKSRHFVFALLSRGLLTGLLFYAGNFIIVLLIFCTLIEIKAQSWQRNMHVSLFTTILL